MTPDQIECLGKIMKDLGLEFGANPGHDLLGQEEWQRVTGTSGSLTRTFRNSATHLDVRDAMPKDMVPT